MIESVYQPYIAIALLTSLTLLLLYEYTDINKELLTIHFLISFISGIATLNYVYTYFPSQNTIFLDWIITTPLLIGALGLTINKTSVFSQPKTILAAVLQAAVIATGYLSITQNLAWFWVGSILLIGVFYLMISQAETFKGQAVVALFFLAWISYPYFFYKGVLTDMITLETAYLGIYATAVFSKQVFAFIDIFILDRIL